MFPNIFDKILASIGLGAVAMLVFIIWLAFEDTRAWEEYAVEHNCQIAGKAGVKIIWVCDIDPAHQQSLEKDHENPHK